MKLIHISTITNTTATLTGYAYNFLSDDQGGNYVDPGTGTSLVWFPYNPNTQTPNFAYSIHTCGPCTCAGGERCFTSVNEISYVADHLAITPNPTSDNLKVSFYTEVPQAVIISVCDLTGTILLHKNLETDGGTESTEISCSGLSDGLYLVTFNAPGFSKTLKAVISH